MIAYDAWGVPHVSAGSLTELAREQGRLMATDRAEQLETDRCYAEGRLAALVGPAGLDWDAFVLRSRLAEVTEAAYGRLDGGARAFVAAYVEGVNDVLGAGTWRPWSPLLVFASTHALFGTLGSRLWRRLVRARLGPDAATLLGREGVPQGSNAFVVGGDRTAGGRPIVAGDPHRVLEEAGCYAPVRLSCPGVDVSGLTFPFMPGVQHVGHAGAVAWGITNAMADYQDERVEASPVVVARDEVVVEVAGAAPVTIERLVTAHGPVVLETPLGSVSVRTSAWALHLAGEGDLGFGALRPLLTARTADDVVAAFAGWVEPVNVLLAADAGGAVRHRVVGRVPHGSGWLDPLPGHDLAPDEVWVSANHRADPAYDALAEEFAPSFRADRIAERLAAHDVVTPATAAAVLADVRQNAGEALLARVAAVPPVTAAVAALQSRLAGWDREMAADSTTAAAYVAVREAVVDRLALLPALAPVRDPLAWGPLIAPWCDLPLRLTQALPTLLRQEHVFGTSVERLVGAALAEVATDPPAGAWGERHRYRPVPTRPLPTRPEAGPPPGTPLGGDLDCVRMTAAAHRGHHVTRGSVARYVWDLAGPQTSAWATPPGAQHPAWAAGGVVPLRP